MSKSPGSLDVLKTTVTAADRIITGYAPDGVFTLVYNNDLMTPVVGSQGDVTYVENADGTALLTLTLSPTSASIPHLRKLGKSRTLFPISITDASPDARLNISAQDCRVQKMPDVARNAQAPTTTCSIFLPQVNEG